MNSLSNTGLPRWLNEPTDWYAKRRPGWLEAVQSARLALHRKLNGDAATHGPSSTADTTNELVGLMLMRDFIRQRSGAANVLPLTPQIAGCSSRGIFTWHQNWLPSPLLQSVFDPTAVVDDCAPSLAAAAVIAECERLPNVSFPVTAFGDYHQLCLARPLGTVSRTHLIDERHARGVHFTPAPLVDYLTHTSLRDLRGPATDIRLLDPSCGSGAFLIAAARCLASRDEPVGGSCQVQRMLDVMGSSIFGTDINSRAVEWARRSLLLSAWECDPDGYHSRIQVPDLRRNLMTADFLAPKWPERLPSGFNVVLGGPPFVRYSELKKANPLQLEDWRTRFVTARKGQFDVYMPFFEQAVRILNPGGRIGWSISNTFLRSKFGAPLRHFLGGTCTVQELVEFENPKVYADAVTQIVLARVSKGTTDDRCRHVLIKGKPDLRVALDAVAEKQTAEGIDLLVRGLPASSFRSAAWRLSADEQVMSASACSSRTLRELGIRITQGVVTGADSVFLLRVIGAAESGLSRVQNREGRQYLVESSLLRPAVRSREIRGFATPITRSHLLLPYDARGNVLIESELSVNFPLAHRYLSERRHEIPSTGRRNKPFFAFRNDAILRLPPGPRILAGMVTSGADATLDTTGAAVPHAGVLILDNFSAEMDPYFLLAILNSPVFASFVRSTMPTMGVGRHVLRRGPLAEFRVPLASSAIQAEIGEMVRQLMSVSTGSERERLKKSVEAAVPGCLGVATDAARLADGTTWKYPEVSPFPAIKATILDAGCP